MKGLIHVLGSYPMLGAAIAVASAVLLTVLEVVRLGAGAATRRLQRWIGLPAIAVTLLALALIACRFLTVAGY
jgi:hypothetical protein